MDTTIGPIQSRDFDTIWMIYRNVVDNTNGPIQSHDVDAIWIIQNCMYHSIDITVLPLFVLYFFINEGEKNKSKG